jgi:hypothetical protein
LNLSSASDAKFEHLTKCQKTNIHKAFCYVNLVKSPTRLPEDPEFLIAPSVAKVRSRIETGPRRG